MRDQMASRSGVQKHVPSQSRFGGPVSEDHNMTEMTAAAYPMSQQLQQVLPASLSTLL